MSERELPEEVANQKIERAKDYMEIYRNLVELLKTNKNVDFTVFGIGNITGEAGGDSAGRRAYQFNKDKGKLVDSARHSATFDHDVVDVEGKKLPLYLKKPIKIVYEESIILGFMENVRGEKGSPFFHDMRSGNRFFAGFQGKRGSQLYTEEEGKTLGEIFEIADSDPETFLQMMEAICLTYIPEYYRELQRLEEKYKGQES